MFPAAQVAQGFQILDRVEESSSVLQVPIRVLITVDLKIVMPLQLVPAVANVMLEVMSVPVPTVALSGPTTHLRS
jgi:hypothetical protein